MNHSKKNAKPLSALLILLLLLSSAHGASRSSGVSVKTSAATVPVAPVDFPFSKKDEEEIEIFEMLFTIRLHGIIVGNYYNVLSTAVQDWDTGISVYETLEADSQALANASQSISGGSYISAFQSYFKEKAQLCREAKNAKLPPYFAKSLFDFLVKNTGLGTYYRRDESNLYKYWSGKVTRMEQALYNNRKPILDGWKAKYNIDIAQVHENSSSPLPFELPKDQFKEDHDYIYAMLLEDSEIPNSLQVYYHVNFLNLAAKSATAVGSPGLEIGLFGADLANKFYAKQIGLASVILDALLDCFNEKLKDKRENNYAEIVAFHEAVRQKMLEPNDRLESLLSSQDFRRWTGPMTGSYAAALTTLTSFTREYITQRTEMAEYAVKLKTFAISALQKFRKDGRQSMDKEITDAYDKYAKVLITKDPNDLRQFPQLPCTAAREMSELSARPETGKSEETGVDKDSSSDTAGRGEGEAPEDEYEADVASLSKTGLTINPGDTVNITASGVISVGFFAGNSGPDGIDGFTDYSYVPQFKHGSLLVRIGDTAGWKFCGSICTIQSPIRGELTFLVNDRDFSNNEGSYQVNIAVRRAKSPRN